MNAFIIAAILIGPPPAPSGNIPLKLHLANDFRSRVIRSELRDPRPFFQVRLMRIEERYKVTLEEDALREPAWQIGKGGDKQPFARGSFAAAGSFIQSLEYICALDQWERRMPEYAAAGWVDSTPEEERLFRRRQESKKPLPFPPSLGITAPEAPDVEP